MCALAYPSSVLCKASQISFFWLDENHCRVLDEHYCSSLV